MPILCLYHLHYHYTTTLQPQLQLLATPITTTHQPIIPLALPTPYTAIPLLLHHHHHIHLYHYTSTTNHHFQFRITMLKTSVHPHYVCTVSNLVFVHVAWYNYVIVAGIVHLVVTICVFLFTLFLYSVSINSLFSFGMEFPTF